MSQLQESAHQLIENLTAPTDQARADLKSLARALAPALVPHMIELVPEEFDSALAKIGFTSEAAAMARLLASRSNDTKEYVINKSLNLYGLALDALEKGNRLAVLTPDDEILHEVVGFDPVDETSMRATG